MRVIGIMKGFWIDKDECLESLRQFLLGLSRQFIIKQISATIPGISGFNQMAAIDQSEECIELENPSIDDSDAFEKSLQDIWLTFSEIDVLLEQPTAQISISRNSIECSFTEPTELDLVFQRIDAIRKLWDEQMRKKTQQSFKAEMLSTDDPLKVSVKLLELGKTMGWQTGRITTVDPNVRLKSGFKIKASYTEALQRLTIEQLRSHQSSEERLSEVALEKNGSHCMLFLGEDLTKGVISMESSDLYLLKKLIRLWETGG